MITTAPAVLPERSLKSKCFWLKSHPARWRKKAKRVRLCRMRELAGVARSTIIAIKQVSCQFHLSPESQKLSEDNHNSFNSELEQDTILPLARRTALQRLVRK